MMSAWRRIAEVWLSVALAFALAACTAHGKSITLDDPGQGKGSPEKQEEGKAAQDDAARRGEGSAVKLLDEFSRQEQIKKQRDMFLADHHTKTGAALFAELEYDKAKAEFEKTLKYDPNNVTAKEHLRKCEIMLGLRDMSARDILDRRKDSGIVDRQLAYHEMKMAFESARSLIKDGDYDEAIERLERARELAKWIAPHMEENDVEQYRSRTEELLKAAERERIARQDRELEAKRRKATKDAMERSLNARNRHAKRLEVLLAQGGRLLATARYEEAQSLAENVLEVDPMNSEARALRDTAFATGLASETRATEKADDEHARLAWLGIRKDGVPETRMLTYPPKHIWDKISKRKPASLGADEGAEPPWKKDLNAKLEDRVSFDFVETPLRDVVSFLQQITNANIILDEKAVGADIDITLKVSEMELRTALDWITGAADLAYALRGEAIFISNKENLGGKGIINLYDVTDILLEPKDFPFGSALGRAGLIARGDDNTGDFDGLWNGMGDEKDENEMTPDKLIQLIKSIVGAGTWVEFINGRLVVGE